MPELTRRYVVMPLASDAPFDPIDHDGVFVLKPWKDPAALRALVAYRENCYPELARDLDAWIRAIQTGPRVRGGIGLRNEAHVTTGHGPKEPGGRRLRKPKSLESGHPRRPAARNASNRRRGHRRRKRR